MLERPDHVASEDPELRTEGPRFGRLATLRWGLWLGIVAGTVELIVFVVKCRYLDPRNTNVSRYYPWMFPVSGILVELIPTLLLLQVPRIRPGGRLGVLSFVAALGVLFRAPIYTMAAIVLAASIAWRASGFLAARISGFDRTVRTSLGVMAGLWAVSLMAHSWIGREAGGFRSHEPNPKLAPTDRAGRNVIWIVLDTVRAGSLGLYGSDRGTSPRLDQLAGRGVRFERAYATAPWTAPSHASMFTGRPASDLSIGWDRPLDNTHATIAEYLASRGYDTAGFVANTTYCSYETGLDRGFAHYEDYDVSLHQLLLCSSIVQRVLDFNARHPTLDRWTGLSRAFGSDRKSADRINHDFLDWLDRGRVRGRAIGNENRPFFAFLNYFDAHHPYLTPESSRRNPAEERMLKTWWDLDKRRLAPDDVARGRRV